MFDRDSWQEILSTIRKNKLRTFLTALGIFWGILMLVLLLGLGNGLESGVFRNFGSGAKNIMYVWPQQTQLSYKGFKKGRNIRFTLDDVLEVENQIEGVKAVSPRVYFGSRTVKYQDRNEDYNLRGEFPQAKYVEGFHVDEGRYLNQTDIDESRKTAIIGSTIKKEIFGDKSPVGERINISGIDFLIVGVFSLPNAKEWDQDEMETISIPITSCYKAFGVQNRRVHQFVVAAEDDVLVSEIEPKVRAIMKERHSISPEDNGGIGGFNLEEEFRSVKNLFIGINALLWFVGIGTLFAGIIGVSNIMLITVKERTKEIGIRKALGATPGSIIRMILTESIFITSIAGYLGLAAGTFCIFAMNYLMLEFGIENDNFYNPKVEFKIAISALVFLILSGTLAGMVPAIKAANVNPVMALKDE